MGCSVGSGPSYCNNSIREGVTKQNIESVIMIIPRRTPPLFFENCDCLTLFFFAHFFFINLVIRYGLTLILVMFETNFGYVLGEIYPKMR